MCVAPMPWVDPERNIGDRIADALLGAVGEALGPLQNARNGPPISLLLNLPVSRPGMPTDLARQVVSILTTRFPKRFDRIGVASLGHAGAVIALRSAAAAIQAHPDGFCLVAGADSYLEPDMLEWLESTDQLHGAGKRNNAWGFIPGEGAGAILVGAPEALDRLEVVPLGNVRAIGVGHESELIRSGTVCLGLGLTQAVRDVVGSGLRRDERVTDVYCDMNGEPYRADEYAFLVTRTREHFLAPSEFVSPADCWGDVGAASAPLLVALACVAGRKGYAKGDAALIWASSVTGERGAVLVETAARSAA